MSIHYQTIGTVGATVGALATAIIALKISKRSADATEAQATATKDAARAADASVRVADLLAKIEVDRRHAEMAPHVEVKYGWEMNERTNKHDLVAYVTNQAQHDYKIDATLILSAEATQFAGTYPFPIGWNSVIHIGTEGMSLPVGLQLEFDAMDPCPCERRTERGLHWKRIFPTPNKWAPPHQ